MIENASIKFQERQGVDQSPKPVSPLESGEFDALLKRGLNVRPFIRSVRRRLWIAVGVTALFAGFAVYKSWQNPQTYRAGFQLLVEPISTQAAFSDPTTVTRSGERGAPANVTGVDYPTQLQVLQSRGILDEIVDEVQEQYPNFNYNRFRRNLAVERVGDTRLTLTRLIGVSYVDSDPELVEAVLAATADRYLRYSLEDRKTRFGEGIRFIEDQLPRIQERVRFLQDQLQELQQQYDFISPELQSEQITTQIGEIAALRLQTQRELNEQRAFYQSLQAQLQLSPNEAIAASALSQDPRYQDLLTGIQQVDQEIAVESVRFSSSSPRLQSLSQRRDNLENLLEQETQRILGTSLNGVTNNAQVLAFQNEVRLDLIQQLVGTASQIQLLEARNQAVAQDQAQLQSQFNRFPVVTRRYSEIEQELGIASRTLEQLLSQRELLAVEAAQSDVPWEIVSQPEIPRDINGNPVPLPQSNRAFVAAIGLGVIAGVLSAILFDRLKNVFYTTEDIQDNVDLPILGIIPFYHGASSLTNINSSSKAKGATPSSAKSEPRRILFLEAFSSLYAGLQFVVSTHAVRSLVIASAEPGDGKSMVAAYLAETSAGVGKKVLLVDADLYRPVLHNRFAVSNAKGLVDILSGNASANDVIQKASISENLYILPAGQEVVGSSRMLASKAMQSLMSDLREQFDMVIYDTPHLLGLTDAHFVTSQADGMLMVSAIEKTKRSVFMQVLNEVKTYELPILGIVANHVKGHSKVSYGYRNTVFQKKQVALAQS